MADITFMRGYGFPKGGQMDYAGYGGHPLQHRFAGVIVNNRRRPGLGVPYVGEPSLFEKIPSLDGMGEFGSEYTFEPDNITPGPEYGPEYRPDQLQQGNLGAMAGWGLAALVGLWFVTRR